MDAIQGVSIARHVLAAWRLKIFYLEIRQIFSLSIDFSKQI